MHSCPLSIWAKPLVFCRNRPESSADNMYRACKNQERKTDPVQFERGLEKFFFIRQVCLMWIQEGFTVEPLRDDWGANSDPN